MCMQAQVADRRELLSRSYHFKIQNLILSVSAMPAYYLAIINMNKSAFVLHREPALQQTPESRPACVLLYSMQMADTN